MRPSRIAVALGALGALAAAACADDGGKPKKPDAAPVNFDRHALLASVAENVMLPMLGAFDARADELETAVQAFCAALGTPDEDARRADAQGAWRAAMVAWQEAEALQIGPVVMNSRALHDVIYSWPVSSSCAVDQDVMLRWNDPAAYDPKTRLPNRRGLDALEYALFTTSLAHTCAPQAAPAGWDALPDADKKAARCGWAGAAAADLAANAQTLLDAWTPGKGDYVAMLGNAGAAGNPFPSAHAAVNAVSDAMFYVDTDVKDMKLAKPAGINPMNSCGSIGEPCPRDLESPWAAHGKENVLANLRGLRMVYLGDGPTASGPGFDDFLVAVNAADVASQLDAAIAEAIGRVEAIPGTLSEAIVDAPPAVADAHAAVRAVTMIMKTEFLSLLGLELPERLADDTD